MEAMEFAMIEVHLPKLRSQLKSRSDAARSTVNQWEEKSIFWRYR